MVHNWTNVETFQIANESALRPIDDSLNASPMLFLNVHFCLLQSLYNNCKTNCKSDHGQIGPLTSSSLLVDDSMWERIQEFTRQREAIFADREKLVELSEVCQELEHFTSPAPQKSTKSDPSTRRVELSDDSIQSFAIIANLIQHRYQGYQNSVQLPTRTSRYEPLLQDVQHHLHSLNLQRDQVASWMRQANFGSVQTTQPDQTASSDIEYARSFLAELDYKIQLWSLLLHDLNVVLAPTTDGESSDSCI